MPSWFDMQSLDPQGLLDDPAAGLDESVARIRSIVGREIGLLEKNGRSSRNLVLAGFSQGAALALHAGLGYGAPLGGIAALSGWPLAWKKFSVNEANTQTPLLLHHGRQDNVIPFESGQELYRRLESAGLKPKRIVTDVAHASSPEIMQALAQMIADAGK